MKRLLIIALALALPITAIAADYSIGSPDRLITNEYAYWNHTTNTSPWEMTSGSLFAKSGYGWTGVPDNVGPNATSSNSTNSAIFRLTTKDYSYQNVKVGFKLYQNNLATTPSTPAVDWDGVHIFLRYQSQYNLYYASVNRRDGAVVIKKKCVGGSDNGGTYYVLNNYLPGHPIPYNSWQDVAASIQNIATGVQIKLYLNGVVVDTATDTGIGCAAITQAGATGIRGDNDNFMFDQFTVTSLDEVSPTPTPTATPTVSATPTPTPTATPSPTPKPTQSLSPSPTRTSVPHKRWRWSARHWWHTFGYLYR